MVGVLSFPILMIFFGMLLWVAGRPKNANWWVGYRMPRACINQETWVFANSYFGKLSMLSGLTTLTFSIGVHIHLEQVYFIVPWVLRAQGVSFILAWLFTEMALRKEFDKNGERRK